MADPLDRNPDNVPGPFYVDNSCIDCDLCREGAPQFFLRSQNLGISYVHAQPVTAEDLALAQELVDTCPSNSIGLEQPI